MNEYLIIIAVSVFVATIIVSVDYYYQNKRKWGNNE